ncbi:MAG: hypothetical protein ACI35S_09945 [Anaeroplasma sp.]
MIITSCSNNDSNYIDIYYILQTNGRERIVDEYKNMYVESVITDNYSEGNVLTYVNKVMYTSNAYGLVMDREISCIQNNNHCSVTFIDGMGYVNSNVGDSKLKCYVVADKYNEYISCYDAIDTTFVLVRSFEYNGEIVLQYYSKEDMGIYKYYYIDSKTLLLSHSYYYFKYSDFNRVIQSIYMYDSDYLAPKNAYNENLNASDRINLTVFRNAQTDSQTSVICPVSISASIEVYIYQNSYYELYTDIAYKNRLENLSYFESIDDAIIYVGPKE